MVQEAEWVNGQRRQGKGKKGGYGNRSAKPLCHNWSKGNGYCRYAAACNFSHDGPQGGTKRKREGTTSLPAKAVKKAKKIIMAMVIEEMKASEEVPTPRTGVAQASDALIALIRGARKRGAASMISIAKSDQKTDFVCMRGVAYEIQKGTCHRGIFNGEFFQKSAFDQLK